MSKVALADVFCQPSALIETPEYMFFFLLFLFFSPTIIL